MLTNFAYPNSFAYSYLVGAPSSWPPVALSLTVMAPPTKPAIPLRAYLSKLPALLRADHNFRQFLLVRSFGTFSSMGNAFLAVYAVNRFQLGDEAAALFTATMLVSQAVLNPILGRLGDRRGHHSMVGASFWLQAVGMVAAALAPNVGLFLAAFALRAAVEAVGMTSGLPIVFQFCRDEDRPTYIGLANTLTSPPLVIALRYRRGHGVRVGVLGFCYTRRGLCPCLESLRARSTRGAFGRVQSIYAPDPRRRGITP